MDYRKSRRRQRIAAVVFSLILTAFTVYVVLDTFVITRVYQPVETSQAAEDESDSSSGDDADSSGSGLNSSAGDADSSGSGSDSSDSGSDSSDNGSGSSDSESDSHGDGFGRGGGHGGDKPDKPGSKDGSSSDDSERGSSSNSSSSDDSAGSSSSGGSSSDNSTVSDGTSLGTYEDDNINITVTEYRQNDTNIYVADITVSSADYLKTAFAKAAYGKNVTEKTSSIASDNSAILAINGDYYGARESGYVIRNGVIYRDTADEDSQDLVIYSDGSFAIVNESDVTAEELVEAGAVQVMSFGPALVTDGEVSVSESDEVGKAKASNPRTAIAMVDDLHYLFIVSDGRTDESEGLSLYELATFAQNLGAQTVYNLDGGGSSTMYFNGEVINQPTSDGDTIEERKVSDIVYIG